MGSVLSYAVTIAITWVIGQFGQRFIWANKKPDGTPKQPWAPSPKGLPYYLNAYSIFNEESYHALTRWSKELGDLFSVNIGQKRFTVLNSADLVHLCLVEKEQLNSSKRASDTHEKMVTDHNKTVYSAPFAVYWARLRRAIYIVVGALYVGQFADYFKSQAKKLSFGISESLREDNTLTGKQLRQLVDMIAMDSALTLVLGEGDDSVPRDPESMLTIIQKSRELQDRQTRKNNRIGQFFPTYNSFLDVLSLFTWNTKLTKSRDAILEKFLVWFDPIYQKRRDEVANVSEEEKQKILAGDKLDAIAKSLLNIEPSKNDPEPVQLTKAEVLNNLVHITLHGYTYLSATIFTLIQRLATEPELQARLLQEIGTEDQSLGHAFVRESLRIDSPHKLLSFTPRTDYELEYKDTLYRIDEDSEIVVNIDAIHKNSNYYPEPEKFNPDRFLKSEKKMVSLLEVDKSGREVVKDHLAFGAGRRVCLGSKASEELLVTILYQIVKNYKLKGGNVEEKVEINTNIWSWTGRTETKGSSIEFIRRS